MKQYRLKVFYWGFITSETETHDLDSIDLSAIKKRCNGGAYAYKTYRLTKCECCGNIKEIPLTEGINYIDGKLADIEEVGKKEGKNSVLYKNMKCNDWGVVVYARTGGAYPYDIKKDDIVSFGDE